MTCITKSGIFVREDPHLGLLTYSPYSGLFYACLDIDKDRLLKWLNKESATPPSKEYEKALGSGWFIDSSEAIYPVPQLLPQLEGRNQTILCAHLPILINWLITGNCLLNCKYCYAQDLMHGTCPEPDTKDIEKIVESILNQNPLVVVLTGGDPLVSPFLEHAIKLLHHKVGIIVDTSGSSLTDNHITLFKKYNVFVRISLDSEIPKVNNSLRPLNSRRKNKCSTITAFESILKCLNNEIKVAVQSVATKKNRSDFLFLGEKLFDLGVDGWRILLIAPSKNNFKNYLDLRGNDKGLGRFNSHILKKIKDKHEKNWQSRMSVQIAENDVPNAIILVSPDGNFLTESNIKSDKYIGKVLIDPDFPKNPRKEYISTSINMHAHTERYLNLKK